MKITIVITVLLSFIAGGELLKLQGVPVLGVIGSVDTKVFLKCRVLGTVPQDSIPLKIWSQPNGALLAFEEKVIPPSLNSRIFYDDSSADPKEMSLKITDIQLSDAGNYTCELGGLSDELRATVPLTIHKYPVVSVDTENLSAVEGMAITVATCYANLSKPAPSMWFVDESGNRVESLSTIQVTQQADGLSNSLLQLTKAFTRLDNGKVFTCMVQHVDNSIPISAATKNIDVQYSPTVSLDDEKLAGSAQVLEESQQFSTLCNGQGNPSPDISWSFKADVTVFPTTESTETRPTIPPVTMDTDAMPKNFRISDNGRLTADSLMVPDTEMTNNGTFTCTASNGIGATASVSFRLGVYETPTTTPPPTTPAADVGNYSDFAASPTPAAQTVNAAVIGGVVAVAIFVLIVTMIVLVRYFMAHKGEYYTNELKATNDVEEASHSDDDDLPSTEADLLGERKRTEHFL